MTAVAVAMATCLWSEITGRRPDSLYRSAPPLLVVAPQRRQSSLMSTASGQSELREARISEVQYNKGRHSGTRPGSKSQTLC